MTCPYCENTICDLQTQCCGEIGHAIEDMEEAKQRYIERDKTEEGLVVLRQRYS